MPESTRNETQLGIVDLTKGLAAAGLAIVEQNKMPGREATYFAIGNSKHQTDIAIPREFLDDLLNTKEHQAAVDSYAHAVAGRLKCGSPEVFYCQSGSAIRASFRWPIQTGVCPSGFSSYVLMIVTKQQNAETANCASEIARSFSETESDIVAM